MHSHPSGTPLPLILYQKQNNTPYYLKMVVDGTDKPLNWVYEPLNGFKLSFSPFYFDLLPMTTFYVTKKIPQATNCDT
jgi:hypothetical protein